MDATLCRPCEEGRHADCYLGHEPRRPASYNPCQCPICRIPRERGVWTEADRVFMDEHFTAIARRLVEMRHYRGGGGASWRIEVDGCVVKFKVTGYAKHGSPIWKEEQQELAEALAEFEKEEEGGGRSPRSGG